MNRSPLRDVCLFKFHVYYFFVEVFIFLCNLSQIDMLLNDILSEISLVKVVGIEFEREDFFDEKSHSHSNTCSLRISTPNCKQCGYIDLTGAPLYYCYKCLNNIIGALRYTIESNPDAKDNQKIYINDLGAVLRVLLHFKKENQNILSIMDYIVDGCFLESFMRDEDRSVSGVPYARYAGNIFSEMKKKALAYHQIWNRNVYNYVFNERNCLYVRDKEGIIRKKYVIYDFASTKTGRLTTCGSSDVESTKSLLNVQVVKKTNRDKILPYGKCNKFLHYDFVAAEVMTTFAYVKDEFGIKCIKENIDPYKYIQEQCGLTDRETAKRTLLGLFYGFAETSTAGILGSKEKAEEVNKTILKIFPRLFSWKDFIVESSGSKGRVVTPYGRQILLNQDDVIRKKAVSFFIQSTCADIHINVFSNLIEYCRENDLFDVIKPIIHLHDGFILQINEGAGQEHFDKLDEIVGTYPEFLRENMNGASMRFKKKISDVWEG